MKKKYLYFNFCIIYFSILSTYNILAQNTCLPPSNITIVPANTDITVTWVAVPGAVSYELEYQVFNPTVTAFPATTLTTAGNQLQIIGLSPCTRYVVKIRTNCGGPINNNIWSINYYAETGNCNIQWPCQDANHLINCSFGEIHPLTSNSPDHFHGAIDIGNADGHQYYPAESGRISEVGATAISIEHLPYNVNTNLYLRKTRYIPHTTPGVSANTYKTRGTSLGTTGDGHLHFEMYEYNETEQLWYRINPFNNTFGWLLPMPADQADAQINKVVIEAINNQPTGLKSGYKILRTHAVNSINVIQQLTQNAQNVKINMFDVGTGTQNNFDNARDQLAIFGTVGPVVNARDISVNNGIDGAGLTVQTISYQVDHAEKYKIDFKEFKNDTEKYLHKSVFETSYTNSILFGNDDYIKLRHLTGINEQFLSVHTTRETSNGLWATKARVGTPDVFLITPSEIARDNIEALYEDGEHQMQFHAEDFAARSHDVELPVTVDNFKPYIKKMTISFSGNSGVVTPLTQKWTFAPSHPNNQAQTGVVEYLLENPTGIIIPKAINSSMTVSLEPSEKIIDLNASDISIWYIVDGQPVSSDLTVAAVTNSDDEIEVSISGNYDDDLDKTFQIRIRGKDLAGNDLIQTQNVCTCEDMVSGATRSFTNPYRTSATVWSDPSNIIGQGNLVTQNFCFRFNACTIEGEKNSGSNEKITYSPDETGSCILPDFSYEPSYDGCTINFADESLPSPTDYTWDFGDQSILPTTESNVSHTYSSNGCYDVTLTVSNGSATGSITKQVCVTTCGTTGPTNVDCNITGPTLAGAGQTITLNCTPIGIGPFTYDWTTPGEVIPSPGAAESITVLMPEGNNNGDVFGFSVVVSDQYGNTSVCYHDVTLSGNIPQVEVLVFSDFAPNTPMAVAASVDIFDLTGPENYYFTITSSSGMVMQGAGCLNTWLPGNNCGFVEGLPQGVYAVCVKVRDQVGVYENCKTITIGNPPSTPPSPAMWMEIKSPANLPTDPITGNYMVTPESGSVKIGVAGTHPFEGYANCFFGDDATGRAEYYTVFHYTHLETGDTYDSPGFCSAPDGIDHWYFLTVNHCKGGTYSITADVYGTPCPCLFPPPNPPSNIMFSITEPLLVDVYPPKPPTIGYISVSNNCEREITAEDINGCSITTYEWKAFDYQTGAVLEDFFTENTNSATVMPSLTNPFFATFDFNELIKVRIQLTIIDQNGFTGQKNQVISFRQPLRINLPDVINRCPGTMAIIQNEPVAIGGSGYYGITWTQTNAQNSYNVLSCTDCLTPMLTASSAGTFTYTVELNDLTFGCIQEKNITIHVQAMSAVNPISAINTCGSGPGINTTLNMPTVQGGGGEYTYSWSPAQYLTDATSASPEINLPPDVETSTYDVTISDAYGCTVKATPSISVTKISNSFVQTMELGKDVTICHGEALYLPITPSSVSSPYYYEWTSNNERVTWPVQTMEGLQLTEENNRHNGTYLRHYAYSAKLIDGVSGCYGQDEVIVSVNAAWRYQGYEPATWFTVEGLQRDLWSASTTSNKILTPSPNNSNPLQISWSPITPTDIQWNNGTEGSRSPNNGYFIPTIEQPQITMTVQHKPTECIEEFKSIRYIIGDSKMDLTVTPDISGIICTGENLCLNLRFDMHLISGQQLVSLPSVIQVQYQLKPPTGSNQAIINGTINLPLVSSLGVFEQRLCINIPFSAEGAYYFSADVVNEEQFGRQLWSDVYQGWSQSIEQITTSLEIPVSSGDYGFDLSNVATCLTISPSAAISYDLGLMTNNITSLAINCQLGGIHNWNAEIRASKYIEIHPDAMVTLIPEPNNGSRGGLFRIDPCIGHAKEPEPIVKKEETGSRELKVPEFAGALDMSIQPNPFDGSVTLIYQVPELSEPQRLTITLYDFTGKFISVLNQTDNVTGGTFQTGFNVNDQPPGVYFYEIKLSGGMSIIKRGVKI